MSGVRRERAFTQFPAGFGVVIASGMRSRGGGA